MQRFIATFVLLAAVTVPCVAAPATQPAESASRRVLVLPFVPIDDVSVSNEWIGRGVQKALQGELARVETVLPVTGADPAATVRDDSASILSVARAGRAAYVIHGSYQINVEEIRLIGLVVEVDSGKPIATLKATGSLRDLFELEDSICGQARRALQPPAKVVAKVEPPQPAKVGFVDPGPIANPYAMKYEDPAVAQSRQTLKYSVDYVYPPCGYGGYYGGGFGGCYGGFGGYFGGYGGYDNYRYSGFGPVWGYGPYGYGSRFGGWGGR